MTRFTKTLFVASAALALSAPAAFAGEMTDKVDMTASKTTATPYAPESRTITLRSEMDAEVRGAVARGEFEAIEGPDGRIYYNRNIAISELPDPELELRTLETYTYEHRGVTFTNQLVQEVG